MSYTHVLIETVLKKNDDFIPLGSKKTPRVPFKVNTTPEALHKGCFDLEWLKLLTTTLREKESQNGSTTKVGNSAHSDFLVIKGALKFPTWNLVQHSKQNVCHIWLQLVKLELRTSHNWSFWLVRKGSKN